MRGRPVGSRSANPGGTRTIRTASVVRTKKSDSATIIQPDQIPRSSAGRTTGRTSKNAAGRYHKRTPYAARTPANISGLTGKRETPRPATVRHTTEMAIRATRNSASRGTLYPWIGPAAFGRKGTLFACSSSEPSGCLLTGSIGSSTIRLPTIMIASSVDSFLPKKIWTEPAIGWHPLTKPAAAMVNPEIPAPNQKGKRPN